MDNLASTIDPVLLHHCSYNMTGDTVHTIIFDQNKIAGDVYATQFIIQCPTERLLLLLKQYNMDQVYSGAN